MSGHQKQSTLSIWYEVVFLIWVIVLPFIITWSTWFSK
jgi:hypothetical protein